jgi:hypothetical protein
MESEVWVDLGMNAIEIAALGGILVILVRAQRNLTAMLRVLRRMDRKTKDTKTEDFLAQAEVERAKTRPKF